LRVRRKKNARVKIHKNIPLGNKRFRLNVNKIYAVFCTTFALLLNNTSCVREKYPRSALKLIYLFAF